MRPVPSPDGSSSRLADRSSPSQAKLRGLRGPHKGVSYALESDVFVLGRGEGCDLRLSDASVSRRHLELRRTPSGWVAKDLGSGNGSGLNGERLVGESLLQPGDVLMLGASQLRFELGEASQLTPASSSKGTRDAANSAVAPRRLPARPRAPRPRNGTSPTLPPGTNLRRLRLTLVGILLLVVLPLSTGVAVYLKRSREEAAVRAMKQEAAASFKKAQLLLAEGKWDDAKVSLMEAASRDASLPVQELALTAAREKENEARLNKAKLALLANELPRAASELSRVRTDTLQTERFGSLQAQLRRMADERIFEAQQALDRGDVSTASRLATEVRDAMPSHDGALGVLLRVTQWRPPPKASSNSASKRGSAAGASTGSRKSTKPAAKTSKKRRGARR